MARIPDGVVSATLEDVSTGQVLQLSTKEGSGCHFVDRFHYGDYKIGLRFDWTDLDVNGDPTLDADFFRPGESKPIQHMKRKATHHTQKTVDPLTRQCMYNFKFEKLDLKLLLTVTKRNQFTINSDLAYYNSSGRPLA
jgi:hypothetical protein